MKQKIKLLRDYFSKREEILMAFIFGSYARNQQAPQSDFDIAVYFRPNQFCELETKEEYLNEGQIWADVEKIVQSEVDFLVLNRARPSLVFSILNSGFPLIIKDRKLYLRLLIKTHYEAIDFWNFNKDFFSIGERARSLSEEDKAIIREHLRFLEIEFGDLENFKDLSWQEYSTDRSKRRDLERLIENLVMAAIDISKVVLASEKREIPQTYRETLFNFTSGLMEEESAKRFAQFAEMRNILVHEYLDIKWERIKKFITMANQLYPIFIREIKGMNL